MIETIPLDRLMLSSLNVRRTERDADIAALAENIAARGLKQNLVVIPAHFMTGESQSSKQGGKGWEGMYEVIAGGRRFQAMSLLVETDRLPADHPVPCMVEQREEASETSLSENLHRVAMNPADELDAFRAIVDDARERRPEEDAVAYCARRFGVAVKHVQGRLRLASLAPEVLEALRGETLSLNDGMAKFVGLEAYLEAGGRIEVEMFMGADGEQRIADIKLLEKLAWEKAEPMVPPAAKADGFKAGLLAKGVGTSARWPAVPEGMERLAYWHDQPTKAQTKKCVGVYAIASTGAVLDQIGMFRPIEQKAPAQERDWDAERRERQREWAIERKAAQLAVYQFGQFTGTPFEGHAFWPSYQVRPVEADPADENFAMVAVLVRVPMADINARRAEAERIVDEEAAAADAAKQVEAENAGNAADEAEEQAA
ncbi:MAG TPA: ParB/Srx family N-terminal domain-containing protein [Novosphingobium sp.]|nr:ParB/Srx family N-terminal domain-containing protein [Novosphingobium sp.]